MATDSYVQLPTDSTGKKVRNVSVDVVQPDGTIATVLMQCVSIVDQDGRALDLEGLRTNELLTDMLRELQLMRRMQMRQLGQLFLDATDDDNQPGLPTCPLRAQSSAAS